MFNSPLTTDVDLARYWHTSRSCAYRSGLTMEELITIWREEMVRIALHHADERNLTSKVWLLTHNRIHKVVT
jgi:hypothetical protein